MRTSLLATLAATALLLTPTGAAAQSYLLVVSGLGGEPEYVEAFHEWGNAAVDAARTRYGIPRDHIIYLAPKPERDPDRINGRSTRDNVAEALRQLAGRAEARDEIFLLLIGHGSSDGTASQINLPGPDLTAAELAKMLDDFPTQRLVVVTAASASGGFIDRLSGPNRIIITATKSPFEKNASRFGEFFVNALAGDGADVNKDGRVSVLEAFDYARRETARHYEAENQLATEHALLDDNGDGQGSDEPGAREPDGTLAQATFWAGTGAAPATRASVATSSDAELGRLRSEKAELEGKIEALKIRKAELAPERYQRELEDLLVELALKDRAIREREGKKP